MDEGGYLADKGKDDGEDGGTADNPGAVYACNGHDAHVFAVRRIRRRAEKARQDVGHAVGKEGAVQARVFDEVAADDVAGHEEVSQVLGQYDEQGRHNHHDSAEVKLRLVKRREGKPRCFLYVAQVDDAHEIRQDIAGDDADQDGNDA